MGIKDNNIIKIHNLNKEFVVDKNPIRVLNDINLEIKEGEFITIVVIRVVERAPCLKLCVD